MHAYSDDRIVQPRKRNRAHLILLALLLVAGGITGVVYWQPTPAPFLDTVTLPALPTVATEPATAQAVVVPAPAPAQAPANTAEQMVASEPPLTPSIDEPPLPLLDESDAVIKAYVAGMVGESLREPLAQRWFGDNLLRRFVTFVANLAEGKLDTKSSPLIPPKARFAVTLTKPLIMTTESQNRFNTHIQIITSIPPATCAAAYRRYYPLLHTAYADLGEKKSFHSVMLAAIDRVLAAPEPSAEPELVSAEKGLYKFNDPALEALPAAQKPLLRMGRNNASQLKAWLHQVRAALLATPVSTP